MNMVFKKSIYFVLTIIVFLIVIFNSTNVSASSITPVYSYTFDGVTYISNVSKDHAWDKAMQSQLEEGKITMEDVIEDYVVFGSRDIYEIENNVQTYSLEPELSGVIQWQPDENCNYLPLQGVRVELYFHYTGIVPIKIDETYTNYDGSFNFSDYDAWKYKLYSLGVSILNGAVSKYSIRVYPSSETFKVAKDWAMSSLTEKLEGLAAGIFPDYFTYFISSSVKTWIWNSSGSFGTIQIPYTTDNDTNKSFYISQALYMGQKFALDICNFEISKEVTTLYPFNNFDSCFCWNIFMAIGTYVDANNSNNNLDFFNDWESIIHEYGHFLQANLDINNIDLVSEYLHYGPDHTSNHNHMAPIINGGKENKMYGAKLAWTEAWATIYSLMTIDYYIIGYYEENQYLGYNGAYIQNIDTELNNYNSYILNINNYNNVYKKNMCEGQEDAIISFIWDIYKKDFYGLVGFLKTAALPHTYYFSNFAQNLYNEFSTNINEIGIIMSKYQLSPGNFTINNLENLDYNTTPQVSWRLNGSFDNPLEHVEFHFLNKNGDLLYKTQQKLISANYNDTVIFTISSIEWEAALNCLEDKEMYLSVVGYNNQEPVTGGYYSKTVKIDINFPVFFFSLTSDEKSYILNDVWNKEMLESLEISETFNNKPVSRIYEKTFEYSENLHTIIIPSSVEYIDSYAFSNCSSLNEIRLLKEANNIISLGESVFDGCALDFQIIVPQNRIAEYKNAYNWEFYNDNIVTNNYFYRKINVDCETNSICDIVLNKGYNKLLKLNVDCSKSYSFSTSSDVIMKLYDSTMKEIYTCSNTLVYFLTPGTYYFDVRFSLNTTSGIIYINYNPTWLSSYTEINMYDTNDISSCLHLSTDNKRHGLFNFYNNDSSGFYKISLKSGSNTLFPKESIKIYTDSAKDEILDRYYNKNIDSITYLNENELYVYLSKYHYYYLDILIYNYSNVTLTIERVETNDIDYLDGLNYTHFDVIFEYKNLISYFEEVNISQRSKIELDIVSSGSINESIPIYVLEKKYDASNSSYYLYTKLFDQITSINRAPIFTLIMDPGTYYFGFHNNTDNVNINFALRRIVDYEINMTGTLVADPAKDQGYALGSEVLFNNGLCDNYTITEGFTRSIYLMVEDRVFDPMSRLEYDWYSNNDNIAKVTEFGTVLAMPVDEDTEVTIFAILKVDPSIVYYKTFTILNDLNEELIEIESEMDYSFSRQNGTYQLELDSNNSPFPMIQYYTWEIINNDDEIVTMDNWGNITSTGETVVEIIGTYNLNPRVKIYIILTILE